VTTKKIDLERLPTVVIENVEPCLDGGRYPIKRVVGQELKVSADIFKDGHDQIPLISSGGTQRTQNGTGHR